jgi:hypothetical protein
MPTAPPSKTYRAGSTCRTTGCPPASSPTTPIATQSTWFSEVQKCLPNGSSLFSFNRETPPASTTRHSVEFTKVSTRFIRTGTRATIPPDRRTTCPSGKTPSRKQSFSNPRAGDAQFSQQFVDLNHFRFVTSEDVVPTLPLASIDMTSAKAKDITSESPRKKRLPGYLFCSPISTITSSLLARKLRASAATPEPEMLRMATHCSPASCWPSPSLLPEAATRPFSRQPTRSSRPNRLGSARLSPILGCSKRCNADCRTP